MPSTFVLVTAIINGVISITATLANGMIIYTFANTKSIRSINNIFLVQLAFADILKAGIILSVKTYNQIMDKKSINENICLVFGALYTITTLMDVLLLTAIAIVRFYRLIKWQAYERVFSTKRAILYSVLIQSTTLIISTFPILGIGKYSYSKYHGICFADWSSQNILFRSVFYFFIVAVSFTIISYCYARLIRALKSYKRRLESGKEGLKRPSAAKNAVGPTPDLKNGYNASPGTSAGILVDNDTVINEGRHTAVIAISEKIKAKQRDRNARRYNEGDNTQLSLHEIHVTKVMFATVIAYAICWFPMFIITLLKLADAFHGNDHVIFVTLTLVALNTFINPMIYGVCDNRFRSAMKTLILNTGNHRNTGSRIKARRDDTAAND
ncbi:rhodopsin, GQ-coupled-like [Rhopilema esculentum]|uniref:rhodopsin, GQ-coupled-like n=1 Tax=Rhopilema esculentum TaxID=499914 RepID=UPI0031CFD0DF|eukprot:gene4872-21199_t